MTLEERAIDIANQVEHEDIKAFEACALRHLKEAIATEREACVAECERVSDEAINTDKLFSGDGNSNYSYGAAECANRIRARSDVKPTVILCKPRELEIARKLLEG